MYVYAENFTHFGHRRRTLRTRFAVWRTLLDVYGHLRTFTWRISRILDTVEGIYGRVSPFGGVYVHLRGGSYAFWTP